MSFTNGTIGEIIKVLDMAGVEMLAISLPDSRIVDVTKSLAKHWQCSKYEVIGQQLSQSEESPYYAHYVNKEVSGVNGQAQMLVEIVKANGPNGKVTHQFKPQHHKDGKAEYLLLIGKQSHKAQADKQSDEYQRLQLAVEAGGYVSWEISFKDYSLNFAPEIYEMIGWNSDEQILTLPKWNTLIHPQDVNITLEAIAANAEESEKFIKTQYRVKHNSGSYIWIEIIARLIKDPITRELTRMIGLCREITEEMRKRHQIETSEQNLSRSQALAKMGSWVMDLKSNNVDWSDNMYALIGVPKTNKNLNHNFESLTSMMDNLNKDKWFEALEQAKVGHAISGLEVEFCAPEGEPQILTVHIDLEYGIDGTPTKLHGICQNITEQSMLERKFLQAQKMESVGQLTGGIAHDFNNLMMVVLGNLQLLEKLTRGDDKATSRLNTAIDAVNKGTELTKRLLAFSRQQTLETAAFPVNDLVTDMEDMLNRALRGSIELQIKPGKNVWNVKADKSQLETAVLNLVINARDAMGESGSLTIETSNQTLDKAYTRKHEDVVPGDYVMIAVTDTGQGMPPEIIDKVLQPFFTTKAVGEGSGLGLSMIYGFVKQSKGHLAIYSEVGHGTTIRIYLPRCIGTDIECGEECQQPPQNQPFAEIVQPTESQDLPNVQSPIIHEAVEQQTVEQQVENQLASQVQDTTPLTSDSETETIEVKDVIKAITQEPTNADIEPEITEQKVTEPEFMVQDEVEVDIEINNEPTNDISAQTQATEPTQAQSNITKTPIVLIAEDNDPVRDVAVAMIEDMGYIVLDAPNGDKALDIIKQRDDIDLLLSDVVMPGMNGPELAAEALKIRPDLKVLFASGYTQGTAEEMHELPNFIELIDKPFTQQDLTDKVRAAVEDQLKKNAA